MMLMTAPRIDPTADLLHRLGVHLAGGRPCVDFGAAEGAYIHHSTAPVALAAYAQASPAFAQGKFPRLRFVDVVAKAPAMDMLEKRALAAVCGVTLDLRIGLSLAAAFADHLNKVRLRHGLDHLFERNPTYAINGIDVRPRGIIYRTGAVDPEAMRGWRLCYRALPAYRQMMAATVLCLYRGKAPGGGTDKTWLYRQPHAWHAAEAIPTLQAAGSLQDWGKLLALYPGW